MEVAMPTPEEQQFYNEAKTKSLSAILKVGQGKPSWQIAIIVALLCMLVIASAVVRIADQPPDP
jgi:hypothetical protein